MAAGPANELALASRFQHQSVLWDLGAVGGFPLYHTWRVAILDRVPVRLLLGMAKLTPRFSAQSVALHNIFFQTPFNIGRLQQ